MGVAEKVWGDYPVYYKQPFRVCTNSVLKRGLKSHIPRPQLGKPTISIPGSETSRISKKPATNIASGFATMLTRNPISSSPCFSVFRHRFSCSWLLSEKSTFMHHISLSHTCTPCPREKETPVWPALTTSK